MNNVKGIVFLFCILAFAEGSHLSSRIIGGTNRTTRVPFMASVRNSLNLHICSANIIGKRYAITTALCAKIGNITNIRVNMTDINSVGTSYPIEKVFINSNYTLGSLSYNIALMRTATPIVFNNPIVSAATFMFDTVNPTAAVTVFGWDYNTRPTAIQALNTSIITKANCDSLLGTTTPSDSICTLGTNKGLCFGDEGSGIIINDNAILAIATHVVGCAQANRPDVNIDVRKYVQWIISVMADN